MKLAYWMYAGPAHIGTLRIASSFKNVHGIMHAPLGDDVRLEIKIFDYYFLAFYF